ncbi:FlaA1/EpsC-like NDP-sugar epimerase [Crossiella equi]|uniref:FlaA1/EpsC-like NDP-sugar epimerase n=1 Tax=Crossiella equi TaxID=130796 RepID=A0ABS5A6P2_9PSEU|nr:polysaccharide biosynthesis protein [Crossiella equi]MBP2471927.1 FlaA1/EpsC-like NDP-sugar epimerase [Crossiella equi]
MNVDDLLKLHVNGHGGSRNRKRPEAADRDILTGKRVLVTGAGGSIGSAVCRAVATLPATRLVMLDRDDSALHALQLSLAELPVRPGLAFYLRDICVEQGLTEIFERERPQVVLHAAALKHVPLLEQHPAEAYRVNVLGTGTTLAAAAAAGTEIFVNISTDKASNPSSVLGITKRLGERLTSYFSAKHNRRYLSVRFGNVLGSRGSFLTTFAEQIRNRRPLLVTHEDVTRFLMSVEDAVELIVLAAAQGAGGETLISNMGKPVRILDIAHSLLDEAGADLPIEIVGLRPGDKLHEDYLDDSESPADAVEDLVRVKVEPLDPAEVRFEDFLQAAGR